MKIVVLDGYTLNPGDLSWDALRDLGTCEIHERTSPQDTIDRLREAEVALTNKVLITRQVLDACPDLKYVGVLATGYNVVDIVACKERGVKVTNVPAYSTASVAQLAFALLLELTHHVGLHSDSVKIGDWSQSVDFCYWRTPLIELEGQTIGVIGAGRIGSRVLEIAHAFGMNTQFHDPTREGSIDLSTLLATSDVVSLHCPLTDNNKGLINKSTIEKMKATAFLLNTSRGPLIVDHDLADALNQGIIAGAGIDVLSEEPPKTDNPLLKAKNCLITPHIAWASYASRTRLMQIVVENLASFMSGNAKNVVNE